MGRRSALAPQEDGSPTRALPWDDLEANHPEAALVRLSMLPAEQWTHEAWECKVAVLRKMGSTELAWQAAAAGLMATPSFGLWLEGHAIAVERGDLPGAELALKEAGTFLASRTASAQDRAEWFLRVAEFAYFEKGEVQEALEALDHVPPQEGGHDIIQLRTRLLMALGRFTEAQPLLERLSKQRPRDADLLLLEAECLCGLGDWREGRETLRTLPLDQRQRADYWHLEGRVAEQLGEKQAARDCYERAQDLAPTHPGYALDLAHVWMDLGDLTQAERQARRALNLAPSSEEAFLLLAECRRGLQDPEGARRLLRECLLRHPESTEAQHFMADLEAQ